MSDYIRIEVDEYTKRKGNLCSGCVFDYGRTCSVSGNPNYMCTENGKDYIFAERMPEHILINSEECAVLTDEMCGGKPPEIVSVERAMEALESLDDYARMDIGVNPIGPYNTLKKFIEQTDATYTLKDFGAGERIEYRT